MCGDSTVAGNWEKLLAGKKANLIFTDPPYNVDYDYRKGGRHGLKNKPNRYGTGFDDNRSESDFTKLLEGVFTNLFNHTEANASFYCWHGSKTAHMFRDALLKCKYRIAQTIFWIKTQPTFNRGLDYLWIVEPCFFGWKDGQTHYANKKLKLPMENIETLTKRDFIEHLDIIYSKRDSIKDYIHPTQKPLALAERALKKHSQQGSIVLDAFAGSGSTLMACQQLGRICYTMEMDPKFIDVILKRWEKATSIKPVLVS